MEEKIKTPINLFIDTNIFLSFYQLKNSDLEELRKLVKLIRKGKVNLYVPQQVEYEFRRNRDSSVHATQKKWEETLKLKSNWNLPVFYESYEEYSELMELRKKYGKLRKKYGELTKKLSKKSRNDIKNRNLEADKVIEELFRASTKIENDSKLIERAERRKKIGNPPGKKKSESLGDAIVWESLLQSVPNNQDINFITNDKDYISPLDRKSFDNFLLVEWEGLKGSKLSYYNTLTEFFKDKQFDKQFDIELENEEEINKESSESEESNSSLLFMLAQQAALQQILKNQSPISYNLDILNNIQKIAKYQNNWQRTWQEIQEIIKAHTNKNENRKD